MNRSFSTQRGRIFLNQIAIYVPKELYEIVETKRGEVGDNSNKAKVGV